MALLLRVLTPAFVLLGIASGAATATFGVEQNLVSINQFLPCGCGPGEALSSSIPLTPLLIHVPTQDLAHHGALSETTRQIKNSFKVKKVK
jgi:hypothetical protein